MNHALPIVFAALGIVSTASATECSLTVFGVEWTIVSRVPLTEEQVKSSASLHMEIEGVLAQSLLEAVNPDEFVGKMLVEKSDPRMVIEYSSCEGRSGKYFLNRGWVINAESGEYAPVTEELRGALGFAAPPLE